MKEIAVYIHFPYCELKCPYCDFNSHVSIDFKEKEHLKAYKFEVDFWMEKIAEKHIVKSVFFGGGTPSLMSPETVFEILDYIKHHPLLEWKSPEITLEANPSSSEYSKFTDFKKAGINRLSIGIQSLNPANLKFLGRKHNEFEAKNALLMAGEIFENFSFDLIYHLPNQTLEIWEKELTFALENYAKNHISLYTLTIEKGTPFFKMHMENQFALPEKEAEFYDLTNAITKSHGFERYEISNYAKNQQFSQHNLSYWQSVDYLGIGAGAHGRITVNSERYATYNFANPEKYVSSNHKFQTFQILSEEGNIKETLLMNLRAKNGIDLNFVNQKYNFNFLSKINKKHLTPMLENGLISMENGFLKLTDEGMSIANSIILKLMP